MADNPTLSLKGLGPSQILFRNFQGAPREFNNKGDRNFCIKLDPEQAKRLGDKGWRVKQLKPRGEETEGDWILKVKLNYETGSPPRVFLTTSGGTNELGQGQVWSLDAVDIDHCDVFINGWWSEMAGGGYSAYLKTIGVTSAEDEIEAKYGAMLDATPPDIDDVE